ncbi:MAG TPA: YetF domain-containing protein [Polyangiaceae bacterium]|nr:YetF domain-containing protein [Polyangiaceae bacterium]
MSSPIELGDWTRILRGKSSWWFVPEALLRLTLLYVLLIVALRLMGRRMSSGLSRNELLALVSLAAAIGPAIQTPEQGLLPPLIIAVWVVAFQRSMTLATFHSHRFENLSDGTVSTLVSDGRIDLRELRRCALPVERVHAQLRGEGIINLGQVARLFFEPGGAFSVVRREQEQPGLSLVPEWDEPLKKTQRATPAMNVCGVCGALDAEHPPRVCPACSSPEPWRPAVCGRQ